MMDERVLKERFEVLFTAIIAMVGAARDAFNRHGLIDIDQINKLQSEAGAKIIAAMQEIDDLIKKKPESERPTWLRAHSLLTHLKMITQNLGGLEEPIRKKIKERVLFSDKAVSQTNQLFDHQTGMLRTLLDIIKTNNEFLKKYSLEEGKKLVQACIDYATEHEARLIEGVCLPQASPIFLAILDRLRTVYQHEEQMALLLAESSP